MVMDFSKLSGTKYPDSQVMRWFFEERLFERPGIVLELGCGYGNNLIMFQQYGWSCVGVEQEQRIASVADNNLNLSSIRNGEGYQIIAGKFPEVVSRANGAIATCGSRCRTAWDAFMMPGSLYYVSRSDARTTLCHAQSMLKSGADIFVSVRGCSDYRYARGEKMVDRNCYILDTPETGEQGVLCQFYHEWEIVEFLRVCLRLKTESARVLNTHFENVLNGEHMMNHDIIVWGVAE